MNKQGHLTHMHEMPLDNRRRYMSRKAYRTRIANGQGSVRKKIITRKGGKKYEFWEARHTIGYDTDGKQIQ